MRIHRATMPRSSFFAVFSSEDHDASKGLLGETVLDSDSPQSDDPRTGGPAIGPPDGDPHPVDTVISLDGLQLTIVRATLGATVQLVGELDLTNASEVWRELEQVVSATPGDLTLDLAGLAFVDSRGLSVLIRLAQRLQ